MNSFMKSVIGAVGIGLLMAPKIAFADSSITTVMNYLPTSSWEDIQALCKNDGGRAALELIQIGIYSR